MDADSELKLYDHVEFLAPTSDLKREQKNVNRGKRNKTVFNLKSDLQKGTKRKNKKVNFLVSLNSSNF